MTPPGSDTPCTNAHLSPPANSPPYLTESDGHHTSSLHPHHQHQLSTIPPHLHPSHSLTNLNHQAHHSHHYNHHQLTAHNNFPHPQGPIDTNSSNSSNSSNNHSVETLNTSSPNSNSSAASSTSAGQQANPLALHYSLGSATSGISPNHIYNHSPLPGGLNPHTSSSAHHFHHQYHHHLPHIGAMRSPDTALHQTSMQLSVHGELIFFIFFPSLPLTIQFHFPFSLIHSIVALRSFYQPT